MEVQRPRAQDRQGSKLNDAVGLIRVSTTKRIIGDSCIVVSARSESQECCLPYAVLARDRRDWVCKRDACRVEPPQVSARDLDSK